MRMLKKLCQCIGLASLVLVMNYGEMLGGGADIRMHYPHPLTGICIAYIADILVLGMAIFAVLAPLERQRFYPVVRLLLAMVIPPYLLSRIYTVLPFDVTDGQMLLAAVLWAALLLTLRLRSPRSYRITMRGASALAAFFALFAFASIGQLLWIASWKPGPQQRIAAWESTAQPLRVHPRVIWIVFDELSFDQVFEHRAHDLSLPNFDALRSQSTLFTDVQPSGLKTVKVIPSLLTGRQVEDFHFSFANRLRVRYLGDSVFTPLDGSATIFADAQQAGFRTAAVGWYNPYCTVYASAIDNCYWSNLDKFDGPMVLGDPLWRNTFAPLQQMVREVKSPSRALRDTCTADVRQRYKTHIDIESHALKLLSIDQADFVFLHFAVPHSPNIWSRIADNYTQFCDSSYLDNLALADRELGKILAVLQTSPRWSDTTFILQGDHSWRTEIWAGMPTWTDEDDEASRRGFDTRPAVIVHQPGQTEPKTDADAWPLINVHQLLEQTLHSSR
jgi:hypothetical protein